MITINNINIIIIITEYIIFFSPGNVDYFQKTDDD